MYAYCSNNPVNYLDSSGTVEIYFADSIIYELAGVLTNLMIGISSIAASLKAALASTVMPVICIATLAVAVTGIVCLLDTVQDVRVTSQEVVTWAKAQVQAKKYTEDQLNGYTVYAIAEKGTTNIIYVGITRRFYSRNYHHQRRPGAKYPIESFDMVPIATGLTYKDARVFEQGLISAFTLKYLDNIINSIAEGNMHKFKTEVDRMNSIISCYFDAM